jgi:hypothetical protein
MSSAVLSMRAADLAVDAAAVRRARADAAALGALQLATRTILDDTKLQEALALVTEKEGDTWLAGSDPLLQFTGELTGATFTVEVWPRPYELRLRALGVCDGVYQERWSCITAKVVSPTPPGPSIRPGPASPFGP